MKFHMREIDITYSCQGRILYERHSGLYLEAISEFVLEN